MIAVDDIEARVRIDELRDAEALVAFQLACAVRAMNLRHNTPDPLVALLAESLLDLAGQRKRAQKALQIEVAG